ncbi:DUF6230 family protein [Streptosporangium sp. NPDC020145]|uniref:DUF6230 family protein n=1 Tax=Streptosporangium sp. NPDC020145 TaxID=3154694 RepID=UPI0034469057
MAEQGRVRWRRFLLILLLVATVTSLLVGAVAQGVVGATFVVSGQAFKLFTDELTGRDFTLSAGVVRDREGQTIPVIVTGVRRAFAKGLCQSALVRTPVGTVTIRITGGQDGNEVTIDDMVIDTAAARGAATLRGVELGRDASTLNGVPAARGPAGTFGGQSRTFTLHDVRLSARAVSAATLSLPDLGLKILRGEHECF